MTDTFFCDVSYFQARVDDTYPWPVLSIRSNDGTFQDPNFAHNYQWCVNAVNSGKMEFFIVYAYWRANWNATAQTMINMVNGQGGPHAKMVAMIDLESGGNPSGDQSSSVNAMHDKLGDWLGNRARVIGYANSYDFFNMWPNRPVDLRVIGAGYGRNPGLPGQVAHQYTDGNGYGGGLPEGAPPFGNCDTNVADGLGPQAFAAACGVGGPVLNAINDKAAQSTWLGSRITVGENNCPDGVGRWAQFNGGYIYWSPATGAHPIPNGLFIKFASLQWEQGILSYPILDNAVIEGGECQAFQGGMMYHQDGKSVYAVHGAIANYWVKLGFEKSALGWPTSDEYMHNTGRAQDFEHGTLYWDPSGVVTVMSGGGTGG